MDFDCTRSLFYILKCILKIQSLRKRCHIFRWCKILLLFNKLCLVKQIGDSLFIELAVIKKSLI